MGQYYKPTIMENDSYKIESTLYSHKYGNGLKLMEHSYIENNFVCAVATLLSNGPKRLAWIGDYAEFEDVDNKEKSITEKQFNAIKKAAWGESYDKNYINPVAGGMTRGFLINHSRKEFINMANYIERAKDMEWQVNPLPLLTAVGNGKGGGDYRCDVNSDMVGDWAFDSIEFKQQVASNELDGYMELDVLFFED